MVKINKFFNNNLDFAPNERLWVFVFLTISGGYIGGFTYFLRGNIFCNAQTGNLLLLAINLAKWNPKMISYTLSSLISYSSGILISEYLSSRVNKIGVIKWHTCLIAFEILTIIVLGFVPDSAPYEITQLFVNFITAMQFNTFRKAHGLGIATTFCTNHVRQVGSNFIKFLDNRNIQHLHTSLSHLSMIIAFVVGVFCAVVMSKYFSGRAIWGALIFLITIFIYLLKTDLEKAKE